MSIHLLSNKQLLTSQLPLYTLIKSPVLGLRIYVEMILIFEKKIKL